MAGPNAPNDRAGELLARLGWATIIAVLLVLSVLAVVSGSARSGRPGVALSARPADSFAAARLAQTISRNSEASTAERDVRILARHALQRDPTAARAVGALAIHPGTSADAKLAAMTLSDRLTRRDLDVQIWLMNDQLRQGNIDGMFRHFQAAAGISREATGILFPVVSATLSDQSLIEPVARALARKPWWGQSLVGSIAQDALSLQNAAALFMRLDQLGQPPRADLAETLATRLDAAGERLLAARVRAASR